MKINQAELNRRVANETGMKYDDVTAVLRALFDVVGRALADGDSVAVTNFGTWRTKAQDERLARNPQTGEPVAVPARNLPRFTYSPALTAAVTSGVAPATFQKRASR